MKLESGQPSCTQLGAELSDRSAPTVHNLARPSSYLNTSVNDVKKSKRLATHGTRRVAMVVKLLKQDARVKVR